MNESLWNCAHCNSRNTNLSKFCGQCGSGKPIAAEPPMPEEWICPLCAARNGANRKFCGACGIPNAPGPSIATATPIPSSAPTAVASGSSSGPLVKQIMIAVITACTVISLITVFLSTYNISSTVENGSTQNGSRSTISPFADSKRDEAVRLGFSSVEEMIALQAKGFRTKQDAVDAEERDRAKKGGFASVEEMRTLTAQGYQTKAEYDAAAAKAASLGFDSPVQMREIQANGFETKKEWDDHQFQNAWEERLASLKTDHRVASDSKNRLNQDSVESQFKVYISDVFAKRTKAVRWSCAVTEVRDDKAIVCKSRTVDYRIELMDSAASKLSRLKSGDRIDFSGILAGEKSWTTSGAIRNPEISVIDATLGTN